MTCRDIVFGDGMTEIRPEQEGLKVFPVQKRRKQTVPHKAKKKRRQRSMSFREMLIIASVALPIILGAFFATVLLRHEPAYICYMAAAWGWFAFVMYANCRRKNDDRG